MRPLLLGALSCVLLAQAPPSLTFEDLLKKARTSPGQLGVEARLAEHQRGLADTRGFLREGPSLALSTGPRSSPHAPTTTDQTVELDLPLFLGAGLHRLLKEALGKADPALREAAQIEARFHLRRAYLDAWFSAQLLALREQDLATVETWLRIAQARLEAGADPAYQVSLVEGEILKALLDLDEARQQRLRDWGSLRALAEVPLLPTPVEAPGDPTPVAALELSARFNESALRTALQARLDLEQRALRQQEALADSRWSVRGSHGREGEERITKVGLAYRFARPGERSSLKREAESRLQSTRRELEDALRDLENRFQSLLARLESGAPPRAFPNFEPALRAIGLRLAEGKEGPAQALPIRRQLLEAQEASLRRLHAAHLLIAELEALTTGRNP